MWNSLRFFFILFISINMLLSFSSSILVTNINKFMLFMFSLSLHCVFACRLIEHNNNNNKNYIREIKRIK